MRERERYTRMKGREKDGSRRDETVLNGSSLESFFFPPSQFLSPLSVSFSLFPLLISFYLKFFSLLKGFFILGHLSILFPFDQITRMFEPKEERKRGIEKRKKEEREKRRKQVSLLLFLPFWNLRQKMLENRR